MFASKDVFLKSSGGGFSVVRSARFRSSASGYLNRTFATPTSSTIWTWSAWVKRGGLTGTYRLFGASTTTYLTFNSSDQLNVTLGGTSAATSTAVYRDPSSWYHIVYQQNGSAQTIYVNNVSVATGTTAASVFNTAIAHQLGAANTTNYFDGYMTEINFVDGQALTPSSFGATDATTGVWQPKQYTGTYGTNGFYLKFNSFATAAALGTDSSGNSNTWTVNNLSVTAGSTYDSMTDVPTLTSATVANYATWNPLRKDNNTSISLANGNLAASGTSYPSGAFMSTIASQGSGLWYAELTLSNTTYPTVAVADITVANICPSGSMSVSGVVAWDNNSYLINGSSSSSGATFSANDVIGVAFDGATRKVWFAKNNTWISSGNPAAGTNQIGIVAGTGPLAFACRPENSVVISANFGQQGFTYTPPSGFVALNTYNLSTPTIPNGAAYMAATTYTGTGATQVVTNTVNGTAMQPDWVWFKRRNISENHWLVDVIRGVSTGLYSNLTNAEASQPTTVSSFNSNGFTVGADTTGFTNVNGNTYVAWQWKANGTGVSNTSGSITSTVSANTTAGFSVVTFTGTGANATVGHGLGVAPSMVIVKDRTAARTGYQWPVWHTSLGGGTKALFLNVTDATATDTTYWNSTVPTSSVFSVGTWGGVNYSGDNFVAYCFSAVAGYSAFGSYTGNGSTDGPFVYTGFRPRFVMMKASSNSTSSTVWTIFDTSRSPYNASVNELYPNLSAAEGVDSSGIDILSNGFKPKRNSEYANFSGWTYIYMAFAENPFKYSLAR